MKQSIVICKECSSEKVLPSWRAKTVKFCSPKCAAVYNAAAGKLGGDNSSLKRYKELYGDVALIKRKHQKLTHGYGTGIHLNLVDNYFQLFFPVYSSDGLEINQSQYADKIRFVIVLDMITLSKLITRKWL